MIDYDTFLATVSYDKIVDMSATSVALCLSALQSLTYRDVWYRNNNPVNDADWDTIDASLALAYEEIMSSLVGLIMPSILATVSAFKFLPCDGGVYNKDDYPRLYEAIDPTYIISGSQFTVPDLRDRVVVGTGNNYALDDQGGADSVTLQLSEIPAHTHDYTSPTFGVDIESVGVPDPTGVGNPPVTFATTSAGGGNAHENRMPYRALHWVIVAG